MSADLTSMFWARSGGTPWHQAGTPIDVEITTPEEAALQAGFVEVVKAPLYVPDGAGGFTVVPTHRAILERESRNHLAICGVDKGLVQGVDLCRFVHPLVERRHASYETGGRLRGGRTLWVMVKMTNTQPYEVVPGDPVNPYCVITMSYDGSAIYGRFIRTRIVCANTLAMALAENMRTVDADGSDELEMERAYAVRVTHTANVHARLEQAQRIMGIAATAVERQAIMDKAFAKARMSAAAMRAFFERVIPDDPEIEDNSRRERARDELVMASEIGAGTDIRGVRGTLWGALNAVTEWVDHGRGSIGGRDPEMRALPDPQARLTNIFLGSGARIKARAQKIAVELVR